MYSQTIAEINADPSKAMQILIENADHDNYGNATLLHLSDYFALFGDGIDKDALPTITYTAEMLIEDFTEFLTIE